MQSSVRRAAPRFHGTGLKIRQNHDEPDRYPPPYQRRPPNLLILVLPATWRAPCCAGWADGATTSGGWPLDKSDRVLEDRYLEHQRLNYEFVRRRLRLPKPQSYYRRLLARLDIDIVLDVTDMDTMPVLAATDLAGVSYVGTSLNANKREALALVDALHPTRAKPRRRRTYSAPA